MRVTMSSVWDRASEVIAGRAGILAGIAAATLWLPAVVGQAIVGPRDPGGGHNVAAGLMMIVVALLSYLGKLAMIAVASDPAVTAGDGYRLAARRLPLLIGLLLLVGVALIVAALPIGVALAPVGSQIAAGGGSAQMTIVLAQLPVGTRAFIGLYGLALALVLLWVWVRLLLALGPVVLLERDGIGSFRRSFAATRGHFWRLLGVAVLFLVLVLVAEWAVQGVVGTVVRLAAGPEHPAAVAFVVALFTGAVAAGAAVVQEVFVARFYLARREA